MSLIGIDPGETTGVAIFDSSKVPAGVKSALGEKAAGAYSFHQPITKTPKEYFDFSKFLLERVWYLQNLGPTTVILENFDFRKDEGMLINGKRQRPKIIYTPSEIVGIVKLLSAQHNFDLHIQSAATGKGFWGDDNNPNKDQNDKLKRAGLYVPGMRHAMDALRHLLHYRTYTQNDPTMLYQLRRP